MTFETYNQVCDYIQANPDVTFFELNEHIPAGCSMIDVLLGTLKYMLNSPAYFKSEDGISWKEVKVPVGIKRGPVNMLDGLGVEEE